MSWSVSFVGKPEKVAEALEAHSANCTGQSKVEYDAAKPHLVALVRENFDKEHDGPVIEFTASGSGYARGDEQMRRLLAVSIKQIYTTLLA
jgi:hypothetical protein